MKKVLHLNRNNDFLRAYRKGTSQIGSCIVTYVMKNRGEKNRVGITVSKKIGNAVARNRAKRVIRAAFINLPYELQDGYDIVFVARKKASLVKMNKVLNEMTKHLSRYKKDMD